MIAIGFIMYFIQGKLHESLFRSVEYILENGEKRNDRTNTGTISSFGHQLI